MSNYFSVEGKVAVVTGGSRGIGAMITQGLVENGVKTYITARKEEELLATQERLSEFGNCIAIASDLSTVAGLTRFADAIAERESALHILVNNAGATWGAPIEEFPESGWDRTMDLNVKSLFFLIQKTLPLLRAAATAEDPARVINIGSIDGINSPKTASYAYSASKAAVHHLTRHLAKDLAEHNINVNGIAPGLFPTKMVAFALKDGGEKLITESIPRRRAGEIADAAGTAIYLSSRASAWVTGHTVVLDGGVTADR